MNWATKTRKQLFPNPEPNHFYTGNQIVEHEVGLPQNYYQWTWGGRSIHSARSIPYTTRRSRDGVNWPWTLGEQQYRWLITSLGSVKAKYRFVFIHHLVVVLQ